MQALFSLFSRYLRGEAEEMRQKDIRLRIMGNRSSIPAEVDALAREVEAHTADCRAMDLTIAVAYGGHEDLLAGTKRLGEEGVAVTSGALTSRPWTC